MKTPNALATLAGAGLTAGALLVIPMTAAQAQAGAKLAGNWESADGSFKIEFQARGKCYISAGPMTSQCTYQQDGKRTVVKFDGETLVLTENDDGSLSSPPDNFIPMRFKKKP